MSDTIVPTAGDIVLLHRPAGGLGVSPIIKRVTGSCYTHSIVVLGPDQFADAGLRDGNDILIWNPALLGHTLGPEDHAVLLRRVEGAPAVDENVLRSVICDWANRAPDTQTNFNTANLAAMAVMRMARECVDDQDDGWRRLWNATAAAIADGWAGLYCSEFVYRSLDSAGAAPQDPAQPFLDLSPYPVEDLIEAMSAEQVEQWITSILPTLKRLWKELSMLASEKADFVTEFKQIVHNMRAGVEPGVLRRADFVAPIDLRRSPTYSVLGYRGRDDSGWTAGMLPTEC